MKELVGKDLFQYGLAADVLCITTNGTLRKNGAAVMGKGCALEAKKRWPGIDDILGRLLLEKGNKPHFFGRSPSGKANRISTPISGWLSGLEFSSQAPMVSGSRPKLDCYVR